MVVYTVRHLLPVVSPPVVAAAVAVEGGRIAASGRRKDVLKSVKASEVRDLGDAVVIPGLVNAHTHLELSWMATSPPQGDDYVGWVRALVGLRSGADEATAREAAARELGTMAARG